ncbi:MAG: hypothetical protein IK096_00120 [Lachnospiraceae bacterium]|nr:hypothetical protein [Lachnospiraceae bacterium]
MEDQTKRENRAVLRWTTFEFVMVVILGCTMGFIYGKVIIPFFLVVGIVVFAALVTKLHEMYGSKIWIPTIAFLASTFSLISFVFMRG